MNRSTTGGGPQHVIALVPYYLKFRGRLNDVPVDALEWPIGRPIGLTARTIGDLGPQDHLFTYPRRWLYTGALRDLRPRISVMIVEPHSFHRHHMWLAQRFHRRFHRILTCNDALLAAIPNGAYFVFGNTWVPDWREKDIAKSKMLSLIASKKKNLKGHKLRHQVVDAMQASGIQADVMGGGYLPFDDKADGLAPYRYSVVIENTREPGYFTEKLVDALLLKTVPVYWGAPDIAKFFDPAGMVICENKAAIMAALKTLSPADYDRRADAIEANRRAAVKYTDVLKSAARVIESTL